MDKSSQFRRFFANAFSITMTDNEVTISLGFHQPPAPSDKMTPEADVVLTHRTLKLIAYNLSHLVEAWEKHNGPIPVDADKVNNLSDNMAAQMEANMILQKAAKAKK